MENIFTDSQVSKHPLSGFWKIILYIFFLAAGSQLSSQNLSTEDKRAIKLYEKAKEEAASRQFRASIDDFKAAIKKDPYFKEPYLKLATIYNLYQHRDSVLLYYNAYISVSDEKSVDPKIWRAVAQLNFDFGNYEKAERALLKFLESNPDLAADPELTQLQQSLTFSRQSIKKHQPNQIVPLSENVNKWQLQYFPVLTGDSRSLIFTKRDSDSAYSDEDLMISILSDSGWTEARSISPAINSRLNEGAASISADGRILIFTSCDGRQSLGSCDLYVSRKQGDLWTTPENLGSNVNTDKWESQPSLSADGRTLYFSSNRQGGYGKRDIWVTKNISGFWSKPLNLGPTINTKNDETTPFIHANNQTLFFSSNGHVGLGGFDIYTSEKDGTNWSKPRNLGYPYNTFRDEYSLFITSDGGKAYFSQETGEKARTEISQFDITRDTLIKVKTSFVLGLVLDAETQKPLGASIVMENLSDSTDVYEVKSDSIQGTYFLTLTEGKEYSVFASRKNYLFEDFTYTTKEGLLVPDTIHIFLQPLKPGNSVVLENIYFDFDKYELKPESEAELKSMLSYLKAQSTLRFMIEGHTDNQGSKAYNQVLSEKRAEAVYNFLLDHGIEINRMTYKGFGSLVPIHSNDTEEGQKLNRRIAFRVLR